MADSSGLIKVVLIGGAAYVAYEMGWLSFLGLTPTATAAAPATSSTSSTTAPAAAPSTPPVTGANSLDAIYTAIVAAANAANVPAAGLNVDGWGYYLNNQLALQGLTAPDPMPIFSSAISGFARSQLMTAAQYWGIMAPALKSQLGLNGLGIYGGLGLLRRRYA